MNNNGFYTFLQNVAEYKNLFLILIILIFLFIIGILCKVIIDKVIFIYKESKENPDTLKTKNYETVAKEKRSSVIRKMIAPDGIDPNPLMYMGACDKDKEFFVRSFTIDKLPKRVTFANTFSELMNFQDCTSSIFIEPQPTAKMNHRLEKQITILEAEWISSRKSGDTNRKRNLENQFHEFEEWADQLDTEDNSFYEVGFLFTIRARDLVSLNKLSDIFHSTALKKSIEISNLYGLQAEAYASNLPINAQFRTVDNNGVFGVATAPPGIKMHLMDKKSASTIYNYTQSSFTHRDGTIIGTDMFSNQPIVFDLFDPSFLGFTHIIAGQTGSGKSLLVKVLCGRYSLHGYRFVSIDSQARKGTNEGEYAALATAIGGVNFQLSTIGNGNILNLFHVSETTVYVKVTDSSGYEKRTLLLNDKISMVVNSLFTIILGIDNGGEIPTPKMYINRVLLDTCKQLFSDFGIFEGDADSLYDVGQVVSNGELTTGKIPKKLPIISDFFKLVLRRQKENTDEKLETAYTVVIFGLKDYVKGLYYAQDSITFFSKEEYYNLPFDKAGSSVRIYENLETGVIEKVQAVEGIKPYYDGQSTLIVNKDCPFTNIDLSQLVGNDQDVARQIAMDYVNECYIKANSEGFNSKNKLLAIFDECHLNFKYEYCRKTLDEVVRTARKRFVSLFIITQSLIEFERYDDTKSILRQSASKFVFKQVELDKNFLLSVLPITEAQAYQITMLGGNSDEQDSDDKNAHKGEVCIVANKKVVFAKVKYLEETEALIADTDASKVEELYSVKRVI